jgi:ribosomal protein L11 methyltransferase
MRYVELAARVPAGDAERASDALRALTGADTWIEFPFSQRDIETDAEVDADGMATVHAYVRDGASGPDAALTAREALQALGLEAEVSQRGVVEEDWAEAWKEHFHVERYGERLVVVPSWRDHELRPDDVVLTLDPGMAFGTGQHVTTRMCLEAIERLVTPGARVLDVGCGSGILSIAAAKLGAGEVRAVDIDPECVRITQENAAANGVDRRITAARGTLGESWPFAEGADGRFDVVVANVSSAAIIGMAADLARALSPDGRLIISGVIGEREPEVVAALTAAGVHVANVLADGEWRCLEGQR